MTGGATFAPAPPADSDPDILGSLERAAERIATPCGGGSMVWRRWGAGPPLVLLHGGYGSWRHWVRTIPAFRAERTLYVPDLPGLGDSAEAPEPGMPETIARVVCDGLARLGIADAALDLVGFSFGSLIGGLVAARKERIGSFTIVGAAAFGQQRNNVVLARVEPGMTAAEEREVHRANVGRLMIADPARIDALAVAIQRSGVTMARVKSRRFSKTDALTDALRRAHPRSLHAIWGASDAVSAPYLAERAALLRSIREDATVDIVPGAGHWVAYEAPAAFNSLLAGILRAAAEGGGIMR